MQVTNVKLTNTTTKYNTPNIHRNQKMNFSANPTKMLTNAHKRDFGWFITDVKNYIPTIKAEEIVEYITPNNQNRMNFFRDLARKLHFEAFENRQPTPENALEIVNNVYQAIEKPDRLHYKLLNNNNFSFEESTRLMKLANLGEQNYTLIRRLLRAENLQQRNINLSAEQITEIVTAPQADKLYQNYADYKSYITLNSKDPNFTQKLLNELSLETPSFDPKTLDKTVEIQKARINSPILKTLPKKMLSESYNPKAFNLFEEPKLMNENLVRNPDAITQDDLNFYEYLMKTTTDKNYALRRTFFKKSSGFKNKENTPQAVETFFRKIDEDENFRKIYAQLTQKGNSVTSGRYPVTTLMYYVDSFGSDVIAKKIDNFDKILDANNKILTTEPKEVIKTLRKNLNNRFYISKQTLAQMRSNENNIKYHAEFFPELQKRFARAKRKFQYELMPKLFGTGEVTPIKMNMDYAEYHAKIAKTAEAVN